MPSSSPYQSRLFQTLRSQTRNIRDNLQLQWRRLKVTATWGVQAGLYPLFVVFQTGRWGGQVLRQAGATLRSRLLAAVGQRPAPVDQPIQNILNAFDLWALPSESRVPEGLVKGTAVQVTLRPIPKPICPWYQKLGTVFWAGIQWLQGQPPTPKLEPFSNLTVSVQKGLSQIKIQGVASLLMQQRLVLVTADNQLLDILTPAQQQQLQQRIIWEIAQTLYLRRQWCSARPWLGWKAFQTLPIPAARPQQLPPVRALYRLLGWVQQSALLPQGREVSSLQLPEFPATLRRPLAHGWTALLSVVQSLCLRKRSPLSLPAAPSVSASVWAQKLQAGRLALASVVGAIALLPFTLFTQPAQAAAAPPLHPLPSPFTAEWLIDPARTRRRWREDPEASDQMSSPSQGKVRIEAEKVQGALGEWASQFAQAHPSAGHSTLEVDAVFLGYDRHPLETLLLWLDAVIAWVEAQFLHLIQRLKPVLGRWLQSFKALVTLSKSR